MTLGSYAPNTHVKLQKMVASCKRQKRHMQCAGGDAFLSRCIWKAGYAFTDPGYSFYHWEAKSFDPGPESSRQLVQDLRTALLGACPPESLVRFPALANANQNLQ